MGSRWEQVHVCGAPTHSSSMTGGSVEDFAISGHKQDHCNCHHMAAVIGTSQSQGRSGHPKAMVVYNGLLDAVYCKREV